MLWDVSGERLRSVERQGDDSHRRLKTNQATRRRVAGFSASQPVALIRRRQFMGGAVLPAERLVEKTLADLDDKAK